MIPSMFAGQRFADGRKAVTADNIEMDPVPSQTIRNHSPDGFEWGYGGSGPAQLALAILLLCTDRDVALKLYMDFKFAIIANLSHDTWRLDADDVDAWILEHLRGPDNAQWVWMHNAFIMENM